MLPLRVVYLTNFVSPDIVQICQNWADRLRQLTLLVSVPMEGNRNWTATDASLDVRVQKTWTRTRVDRHPSGYRDINYVHVPLDTYRQLRKLRPDIIVSTELGARSIVSAAYRNMNPDCRHIIAVNTSEHIESSRNGRLRNWQRRCLLRTADAVTYNGPSCRDFLVDLGVPTERLSEWMYAADPHKIHPGELQHSDGNPIRLLTVGQLIERKGVAMALEGLIAAAGRFPGVRLHWTVIGDGPLATTMKQTRTPENLTVEYRGHCDADQIRNAYRDHELMLFPTMGDEWGLVTDEALHSGLAVVGSIHAQSVTTLVRDHHNGWRYDPNRADALPEVLGHWIGHDLDERMAIRHQARQSVSGRTPTRAAEQICEAMSRIRSTGPADK